MSASNGSIKQTKSTPSLSTIRDSLTNSFNSLSMQTNDAKVHVATGSTAPRHEAGFEILPERSTAEEQTSLPTNEKNAAITDEHKPKTEQMSMTDDSDPLGVSSNVSTRGQRGGLDFAAFASQNAFQDR